MPQLSEIKKKREIKPFKKKEYRVWNLDGKNTQHHDYETKEEGRGAKKTAPQNTQETVGEQLGNSQETVGKQLENTQETVGEQLGNSQETVGKQLENNLGNNTQSMEQIMVSIRNLCGLQEKLFFYILEMCNVNGELRTGKIKTYDLASILGCNYDSAKVVIYRLVRKNLISRLKGKTSQTGFVRFALTKEQKLAGIHITSEKAINPVFSTYISTIRKQLGNNLGNMPSYSSSSNINNTTTNTELPSDWAAIELEPLSEIGFTKNHIAQLQKQKDLSPDIVQKSIYSFAFDLEMNNKQSSIKGSPLNYFMGILRRFRVYNAPDNFESPKDRALREFVEREKTQEAKRNERLKEIREMEFRKWIESMANEELAKIAPNAIKEGRSRLSGMSLGALYPKFEEAVWSQKRKELAFLLED